MEESPPLDSPRCLTRGCLRCREGDRFQLPADILAITLLMRQSKDLLRLQGLWDRRGL